MIPVQQRFRHDPPESYGDCHRAALASVLELPLDDVPHFMDGLGPLDGDVFRRREDDFLKSRGLVAVAVPFDGSGGLDAVLQTVAAQAPNVFHLIGGESRNGCGHTVVGCNGEIVHDPHPAEVGITGPMNDGYFWLTFICAGITRKLNTTSPPLPLGEPLL